MVAMTLLVALIPSDLVREVLWRVVIPPILLVVAVLAIHFVGQANVADAERQSRNESGEDAYARGAAD